MVNNRPVRPNKYIPAVLSYILLLLCSFYAQAESGTETIKTTALPGLYAISLASSLDPFNENNVRHDRVFDTYRLYTSQLRKDGKLWYRLRLGFFPTREAALKIHKAFAKQYPGSWITKVSKKEKEFSAKTAISFGAAIAASRQSNPLSRQASIATLSNERLAQYMEEARQSMAKGDYSRAVNIYTKVLEYPDHPFLQDAQEFLGLARERKKQYAHAKAEYEKYLMLYPKGEGADRVRQRLAGLITASEPAQQKLRGVKKSRTKSGWQTYGSLSQYYRRDVSTTDAVGETVNQSELATDMDISSRLRNSDYDIRSRFTGGYDWDFLDHNDNEFRVTSLYLDATDRQRNLSGRVGRQSRSTGGVLGRFDGLLLGYQFNPVIKANIVTGYPVESINLDEIHTDKDFYGISMDFGTFAKVWDINTFLIRQQVNGILDREATGGELRYFDGDRSFLGLVDYDISYHVLNTLLFLGNWTLPDKTTFSFVLDHRKSPILTTSNALQGQTVATISELLTLFSEDEIRSLAEDRTPDSRSYTLGASRPINTKFQISGDVTMTNLSDTPASGGIEAIPGTGNDYFYSVQLIGNSLIKQGDLGILGLRYADTSSATTTTLTLNSRYPVNHDWRINPRLRLDLREFASDGTQQWTLAPSMRVNYRWRRQTQFEVELGGETSNHELTDDTEKMSSYYVNAGYRQDF